MAFILVQGNSPEREREREREREMKVGKADAVFANLATPLGGVYLRSGREGRR